MFLAPIRGCADKSVRAIWCGRYTLLGVSWIREEKRTIASCLRQVIPRCESADLSMPSPYRAEEVLCGDCRGHSSRCPRDGGVRGGRKIQSDEHAITRSTTTNVIRSGATNVPRYRAGNSEFRQHADPNGERRSLQKWTRRAAGLARLRRLARERSLFRSGTDQPRECQAAYRGVVLRHRGDRRTADQPD